MALVAVLFPWDPEEEVGHQNIRHRRYLLVRDGINLWPLGDIVHGN
jgi:hypothetical protein